jgi:deoxycytidine triphosphate deaminase
VILSDRSLREAMAAGRLVVDPLDDDAIQPSSIDVRLDSRFRVFYTARYPYIDVKRPMEGLTELVEVKPDEPFILHPGEFVLGSTLERIAIPPDLAARLEGKALALDTPIPTADGWRALGDLRAGDRVFDETGAPCLVVAATGVLRGRPCAEVVFSDGERIVADLQHRWRTRRRRGRRAALATTAQVAATLRVGGGWNHQVALAGPVRYPERRLPLDPYDLGRRLTASPAGGRVPGGYLLAGVEQRRALLQGLMDGAGELDAGGRARFASEAEALADAVAELAASLGLRPAKGKRRAGRHGVERGPVHEVRLAAAWPLFRLPDRRARQRTDRQPRARAIVDVRPVAPVPVRCIQVSAPSGLFLAGRGFVPTHNSSLGRLGLLTHSTAGFLDPGFEGHVTLELSNVANLPITLYPGMRIGQIAVFQLTTAAERPYGSRGTRSKYQGQRGPTESRYWENFRDAE